MIDGMKQEEVSVRLACEVIKVSSSGYYAWKQSGMSPRQKSNEELKSRILQLHEESRETYGEPRLRRKLKEMGLSCGKHRVARLMKEAGIAGVGRRRFQVKTTDACHALPIAPRLFQTENPETFPRRPNQIWAGDITYVPTEEGWVFLAVFLDVFTRKVVGYAMDDHMRSELVLTALNQALGTRNVQSNRLILHSDRGSQYASDALRERLTAMEIQASMSRKGNCYDNAYAESFFHTLKVELIHRRRYATRKEAMTDIFEYIEVWYNRQRLHSSLGYLSPCEYERTYQNYLSAA